MPATDSSYVQLFNEQWPWYHFGEENWSLFLFHQACKFVYCMQYSLHSYGYLFIHNDIGTKKICSNCVPTWHEVKWRTTQPDPCLLNKCVLWKHPRSTKKIQLYRHAAKWGKRKSPMCQQNDNYIIIYNLLMYIEWNRRNSTSNDVKYWNYCLYIVYSSFSGWSRKALEFNVPHCFKSEASNFQHQHLALSWKSWWFAAEFPSSFKCFKINLQLCPEPIPGGPTLAMLAWLAGPSRPTTPRPPHCIWWAIWSCMDLGPRFSHWYVLRWHLNWSVI